MKFPNEFKWAIFNQSNSESVLQWFQLIPAFHFCNLFQGKIAKKLQNEMRQTSSEWVQNINEATGKSKPRRHAERRSNKSTGTRSRRQLTSKFDYFLAKTCFEMKWNEMTSICQKSPHFSSQMAKLKLSDQFSLIKYPKISIFWMDY